MFYLSVFHGFNAELDFEFLEQEEEHAGLDAVVTCAVSSSFQHDLADDPWLA